jgi:hypothetical protein
MAIDVPLTVGLRQQNVGFFKGIEIEDKAVIDQMAPLMDCS